MINRRVMVGSVLLGAALISASASAREGADADYIASARAQLQAQAGTYGFKSAQDEFKVHAVSRDQLGQVHVRWAQQYKGLPVFGEQLITHMDKNGKALSVNGTFARPYGVDTRPVLTREDALFTASSDFGQASSHPARVELVIVRLEDQSMHLAWYVRLTDIQSDNPKDMTWFISAKSGQILWSFSSLETEAAVGVGHSLYSGDVDLDTNLTVAGKFEMDDTVRGHSQTTDMMNGTSGNGVMFTDDNNDWGQDSPNDRAQAGVDANFGASVTWDFYSDIFQRPGIKGDGKGALSRVHYSVNYVNAYWSDSCMCMTYGDGDNQYASPLVSIDVAAHEMTHGVTSATAGLVYNGESGGLNESMSDIFGTAVENYASILGYDTRPDYWVGEDVWTPNKPGDALRYMDDPSKDGRSIDHYRKYRRNMDVHYSSGLANNVFYLLAHGGTNKTSNQSVTGIGIEKAQAIFYRALVAYMGPRTDFSGAAQASVKAARDLYTQAEVDATTAAWAACGVN